jgi:hypothetical protein
VAPEGVLVLGMHRSGTSAVAGLANLLGLATSEPRDLIRGKGWNPAGHWESRSLTPLNDQLLAEMGHTWWYPPPSGTGYSGAASRILTSPQTAADQFDQVYPSGPWVWKDPRNCLTLPFWRRALDRPMAGILVFRNPIDVSASLLLRNSLPEPNGFALWERYMRLLLEHAGGLPLLVARYDDVVENPLGWSDTAQRFLTDLGMAVAPGGRGEIGELVDPRHRHSHHGHSDTTGFSPGAKAVFEALEDQVGAHQSFVTPRLPTEDPGTAVELESRWPGRAPAWNDPPPITDGSR